MVDADTPFPGADPPMRRRLRLPLRLARQPFTAGREPTGKTKGGERFTTQIKGAEFKVIRLQDAMPVMIPNAPG